MGNFPFVKTSSQGMLISGYHLSEEDDLSAVKYYDYLCFQGFWLIEKWDTRENVGTHRYARGNKNYQRFWMQREELDYKYFHEAF